MMMLRNFDEWKDCIVNKCKIKLTKDFVEQRLSVYEHAEHPETIQFTKLYGQQHLDRIISWYRRVLSEEIQ